MFLFLVNKSIQRLFWISLSCKIVLLECIYFKSCNIFIRESYSYGHLDQIRYICCQRQKAKHHREHIKKIYVNMLMHISFSTLKR